MVLIKVFKYIGVFISILKTGLFSRVVMLCMNSGLDREMKLMPLTAMKE